MNKKRKNNPPAKQSEVSASTNNTSAKVATQVRQQYSGPIPPPELLHGFDKIVPGAAERIIKMAEDDATHQRNIENSALKAASDEVKRGQNYGLTIGILAFVTCIVALVLGSEKTAMVLGGTTVVGLVTVFVTGRLKKSDNNS